MTPLGSLTRLDRDQFGRVSFQTHAPARNPATIYRFGQVVFDGGLLYAGDGVTPGGLVLPSFFTPRDPAVVYPIGSLVYRTDNGRVYRGDGLTAGGILLLDVDESSQVLDVAATPAFAPNGGYFAGSQVVTITTQTEGASILYTTDGSTPSLGNGLAFNNAVGLLSTTTLKAIAIKAGYTASAVASAVFTKMTAVATPILTPAAEFSTSMQVSMACSTPGATIYYTADGSTPSDQSTEYTGPVTITSSATLKAVAVAPNMIDSQVASVSYTQTSAGDFVYWGKSSEAQATANQIAALLSTAKTSPAGTYQFSSTSNQKYCYFACPAEWTGPTAIMVGAFEWGIARSAPYDTAHGSLSCRLLTIAGVPCRVYRSAYTTAGDLLLTAS